MAAVGSSVGPFAAAGSPLFASLPEPLKKMMESKNLQGDRDTLAHALRIMAPCEDIWDLLLFQDFIESKVDMTLMQMSPESWDDYRAIATEKDKSTFLMEANRPAFTSLVSHVPPEVMRMRHVPTSEYAAELKVVVKIVSTEQEIPRNRLAMHSQQFQKILQDHTQGHIELTFPQLLEQDYPIFLSYLTRGSIKFTDESVKRFLNVAQQFDMPDLMQKCGRYLLALASKQQDQKRISKLWVKGLQALKSCSNREIIHMIWNEKAKTERDQFLLGSRDDLREELEQLFSPDCVTSEIAQVAIQHLRGQFTFDSISRKGVVQVIVADPHKLPQLQFPFPVAIGRKDWRGVFMPESC